METRIVTIVRSNPKQIVRFKVSHCTRVSFSSVYFPITNFLKNHYFYANIIITFRCNRRYVYSSGLFIRARTRLLIGKSPLGIVGR